jgi:hypothetical protein
MLNFDFGSAAYVCEWIDGYIGSWGYESISNRLHMYPSLYLRITLRCRERHPPPRCQSWRDDPGHHLFPTQTGLERGACVGGIAEGGVLFQLVERIEWW